MTARFLHMVALIAVVAPLVGCGASLEDRTLGGTAVGAAMGAAIGGAFGGVGAGPGTLIGGVAGATVGAFTKPDQVDFGKPLWEQYRRAGGDLPAKQTERGLVLTLDPVLFDFDSATLKPEARRETAIIADLLRDEKERQVLIEGHADGIGSDKYNLDLSERRAKSVEEALVDNGIDPKRITTQGLGEDVPAASNDTPARRQQNRRVEVIIR